MALHALCAHAANQRRLAVAIEEGEAAGVERPLLEKARKLAQALRKKKSQGEWPAGRACFLRYV